MKTLIKRFGLELLLEEIRLEPTIILIISAVLVTVHRLFGSMEFAERIFLRSSELGSSLFMFGAAFLLLGVIPLATIIVVFRSHPAEYGLRVGDWKSGVRTNAVLIPVIALALLYPASQTSEMRSFYPFAKEAIDSPIAFAKLEIARMLFFYTAWEFFFRGFMLFGLRRYVGDWLAICIQVIPQCLWHIGMPTGEILSSIAGGILFGVIAVRTNSILWPLVLHCMIGLGLDFLIVVTS